MTSEIKILRQNCKHDLKFKYLGSIALLPVDAVDGAQSV